MRISPSVCYTNNIYTKSEKGDGNAYGQEYSNQKTM